MGEAKRSKQALAAGELRLKQGRYSRERRRSNPVVGADVIGRYGPP